MRVISAAAVLALCCLHAQARELFHGQYAQIDPGLRQWFRDQLVPDGPSKGSSCCSDADGVQAEEDYRENSYWVRFTITIVSTAEVIDVPWTEVPGAAVLRGPFPKQLGQPIVWWVAEYDYPTSGAVVKRDGNGRPLVHIRCFKPGGGV